MEQDLRYRHSLPHTLGEETMSRLRLFFFRLRGLFLKRNLEQELADEIQAHLEMQI